MESDSPDPSFASDPAPDYLPLYFYDLTPELKIQAKKELHEDVDSLGDNITVLRNLIGDNHLEYSDDDLKIILRAAKHDVQRAYDTFKKHSDMFRKYDVLFKNFQFSSLLKPMRTNCLCFLPKRNKDGCVVVVCFIDKWDVSHFTFADIIRVSVLGILDALRCPITQITGLQLIVNFSGLNMKRLTSYPIWCFKFVADAMQQTLPMRRKGYHIVNNGKLFGYMWNLFWPLLSKKLRQRVHLHGHDMKHLHEYISPAILPEELGGHMGPQDNSEWMQEFAKSENYLTTYVNRARSEITVK